MKNIFDYLNDIWKCWYHSINHFVRKSVQICTDSPNIGPTCVESVQIPQLAWRYITDRYRFSGKLFMGISSLLEKRCKNSTWKINLITNSYDINLLDSWICTSARIRFSHFFVVNILQILSFSYCLLFIWLYLICYFWQSSFVINFSLLDLHANQSSSIELANLLTIITRKFFFFHNFSLIWGISKGDGGFFRSHVIWLWNQFAAIALFYISSSLIKCTVIVDHN